MAKTKHAKHTSKLVPGRRATHVVSWHLCARTRRPPICTVLATQGAASGSLTSHRHSIDSMAQYGTVQSCSVHAVLQSPTSNVLPTASHRLWYDVNWIELVRYVKTIEHLHGIVRQHSTNVYNAFRHQQRLLAQAFYLLHGINNCAKPILAFLRVTHRKALKHTSNGNSF